MWTQIFLIFVVGLISVSWAEVASPCPINPDDCKRPSCVCSSTDIPGGLTSSQTPQLVALTFDDGINVINYPFYESLFSRINPNGASIGVTYFVTHENTDYHLVHQLFRRHHEIALHSITHTSNTDYWKTMNESVWKAETVDHIDQMSKFAKVPKPLLKGMRAPFLQTGGNAMYRVLAETTNSLTWESSMMTLNYRKPGLWPYTNDYATIQECHIEPCRNESFPGFWTMPMVAAIGDNGFACSMIDTCQPAPSTSDETYNLLMRNFNDQYEGNRTPFGLYIHYAWLLTADHIRDGVIRFLDFLGTKDDVYMTTMSQIIEFSKNPVPISSITGSSPSYLAIRNVLPDNCVAKYSCHYPVTPTPGNRERYMTSCVPCNETPNYPWIYNPLGVTGSYYFVIVGHYDNPIFEIELNSTQHQVKEKDSKDYLKKEDRSYLNQFVAHASLDLIDAMWMKDDLYLKIVDKFNDWNVSGFVTASGIRFVLLHDAKNEEGIRNFFNEMYEMYIKYLMNAFYIPNTPIISTLFEKKALIYGKKYLTG